MKVAETDEFGQPLGEHPVRDVGAAILFAGAMVCAFFLGRMALDAAVYWLSLVPGCY